MSKKNTHKVLTIKDPSRWGIKFGQKRQWYYKMRLDFLTDPLIQTLKNETKLVFLLVINEALRENSDKISMCLEYIKGVLRVEQGVIKLSLRELKENNIIHLETNVRTQLIEENKRKENIIEQKEKNETKVSKKIKFNLEKIYDAYPRKAGKAKGLEKLEKIITSEVIYDAVLKGAEDYATYCEKTNTENNYIKHFSSWVNQECWKDELEIPMTQAEKEKAFEDKWLEKWDW